MSTVKGDKKHCVLCSSDLILAVVTKNKQNQPNINGMKYQLRTVFVLKKLLGISNSTCCDLLQFGNPSTWLSYCFECYETVIEAEKVFSKLMKLESKWTELKKSVEGKICKQNYSSQISLNTPNSEINHRIRVEIVCRSLNLENGTTVKTEIDEDGEFYEYASPNSNDCHLSEEDNIMTHSNLNSVRQNEENREQDFCIGEMTMPEPVKQKVLLKYEADIRSRSSRLTSEDSDFNGGYDKDENEKSHDLVVKDDNNLVKNPLKKSNSIQCPQCARVFENSYGLHYHKLRYHETDSKKRFRCEMCGMGMTARSSLFRHIEKQHAGQTTGPRSCYKCSSNFSTTSELMDHKCEPSNAKLLESHSTSHGKEIFFAKIKRRELQFKCHKCSRVFPSIRSRKHHTSKTHGKEKPYPCGKCEEGFYTYKSLRLHYVRSHNTSPPTSARVRKMNPATEVHKHREKTVPCPRCELMFTSENVVECHIRQEHDSNFNIPCPVCSRPFHTTIAMKKHVANVHHKEKKFVCEICSKSFVYGSLLKHHQMSEHEKSEKLKCQLCDHFSCDPISLKKHIAVIHNKNSLKFKCPVCSYVAISQSALNAHILGRHTNEKPFPCTQCEKAYVKSSSLKIHILSHTGERPFPCEYCPKRFYSNVKKNRHVEDMHSTGKTFQCEKCGKNFPSRKYLITHNYNTHRKKQKHPVPEKVLINEELLKEAISQNTAEIVKTNVAGLLLEKSLLKP